MENTKPIILVSNDDGYAAGGIQALIEMIRDLGDIYVVAPTDPRSGASASVTMEYPVYINSIKEEEHLHIYSCTGTPVDCVKLAFHDILPAAPQVVIGGINHGENTSINVNYSGTMGIAREGCMKGIPSVGFSLCDFSKDANFTICTPVVRKVVIETLKRGLPSNVCLNVNIPKVEKLKGIKICEQGPGRWNKEWMTCLHPRGKRGYWMLGEFEELADNLPQTELYALKEGYATIVPTQINLTAFEAMEIINQWHLEL